MPATLDERDLLAYADGRLDHDPARREQVAAWLRDHPEEAERIEAYRAQNEALRRRYDSLVHEPVPERLRVLLDEADGPARRRQWLRRGAAALAFLAATAGGWYAGQWRGAEGWNVSHFIEESRRAYTQAAPAAGSGMTPATTAPLDLGPLSVRLPELEALGYRLVARRTLVDGAAQGASSLTYADEGGRSFTLFLRPRWAERPSEIHLSQEGEVSFAYWLEGPLASAVASRLPPHETLAIAKAVRHVMRQPDAAPAAPRPAPAAPALPRTAATGEAASGGAALGPPGAAPGTKPAVAGGVIPN